MIYYTSSTARPFLYNVLERPKTIKEMLPRMAGVAFFHYPQSRIIEIDGAPTLFLQGELFSLDKEGSVFFLDKDKAIEELRRNQEGWALALDEAHTALSSLLQEISSSDAPFPLSAFLPHTSIKRASALTPYALDEKAQTKTCFFMEKDESLSFYEACPKSLKTFQIQDVPSHALVNCEKTKREEACLGIDVQTALGLQLSMDKDDLYILSPVFLSAQEACNYMINKIKASLDVVSKAQKKIARLKRADVPLLPLSQKDIDWIKPLLVG